MKIPITFMVSLPYALRKEGKYIVSCCPVLDLYSQGETEQKALENLVEAARLFLMDCFERGTLDKVLKDCGFVPVKEPMKQTKAAVQKEITVPLPFVIDMALAQCRA